MVDHCGFKNEAKFEKEVIDFTYNSNRLGERDIIRTTPRAKAMHLATVNPSIAFMDIEAAKNLDISYDDASAMYGQVINLSKIIRTNITSNQVLQFKGWTKMRADYKRYYCLKLESLANDKGIRLYRCKDQWGADIVIAQTMKRESRIDSQETDGDVVDYRVDDRESSLDSCLV
ncbi:hypothetical protein BDB01DRAFT_840250 [Pilobolus umbonatus]|nr:hypothetical protein BDB01DRAFT_840250 [Pilobolus umbonatus]